MGVKTHKGFTIIESVLFLGVTGVIMATLLVGVGGALNRERYKDAVSSYQDYLQGQYNLVSNVNNSRSPMDVCIGGKIEVASTADQGRGTSDCTIVGRVIHSTADGEKVTSAQVYATVDATSYTSTDDVGILNEAQLIASPTEEEYLMGWGTRIVNPKPNDAASSVFSILIVRMPTSGVIHTYALPQANQVPASIVGHAIDDGGLAMCVDNSMFVGGSVGRVGVLLTKDAINSSGVQFLSEDKC